MDPREDMLCQKLATLCTAAGHDLAENLRHYWPWVKGSRLHESCVTYHVARLARNSGMHFYPEVPLADVKDNHNRESRGKRESIGKRRCFDGLILDAPSMQGVLVEAKCLGPSTVANLLSDLCRMRNHGPQLPRGHQQEFEIHRCLLLLHTYSGFINAWWMGGYQNKDLPKEQRTEAWKPFAHVLKHSLSGGLKIIDDEYEHRWMLWAVFPKDCLEGIQEQCPKEEPGQS